MGDADLKDKGVSFIAQAVKEDEAGNLQKAFNLYMTGLDYLSSHLKYEKNPKVRDAIKGKMAEYIGRAEQLKKALDASEQASAQGGAAGATKARPKAGANGGGGGGGEGEDGE